MHIFKIWSMIALVQISRIVYYFLFVIFYLNISYCYTINTRYYITAILVRQNWKDWKRVNNDVCVVLLSYKKPLNKGMFLIFYYLFKNIFEYLLVLLAWKLWIANCSKNVQHEVIWYPAEIIEKSCSVIFKMWF